MKIKLNILNFIMIVASIIISMLIFNQKIFSNDFLKSLFETMTNHLTIDGMDKEVANENVLIKVDTYSYANNSLEVYCPFKATVIDIDNSIIVLKCENNYYAYFEDIFNIKVKKFDYVTSNDSLANYLDQFKMYFYKEGIKYSYEEVIKCN